jgi:uncharacterized membrane protein
MWRNLNRNRKGSAVVEAALMMPWVLFLFVGVLDSGFYTYAAMATQNAARAAAIQSANSGGTLTGVRLCQIVKNEMGLMPNVGLVGTCAASQAAVSNASPMWVCTGNPLTNTASSQCGQPARICADCTLDTTARSIQAVVTYQSIPLVPIPGILVTQLQLTRIAEARVIE